MADRGFRRWLVAVAIVAVPLGAVACGSDEDAKTPTTYVPLDGSPRVPDVEGIVVSVADDFTSITLDGDRSYKISKALQSFSSIDGTTLAIKGRVGQYVQVGVQGETAVWVASIADVVDDGGKAVVYYTGTLAEHGGNRIRFKDGTVFTLGGGVEVPKGAEHVIITIDPKQHVVTSVAHG